MGHGVSTSKYNGVRDPFCNVELSAGGKMLSMEDELRASFIIYVKSGLWTDSVAQSFPCSEEPITIRSHASRLARENVSLYGYRIQRGKEFDFEDLFNGDASNSIRMCSKRTNSSVSDAPTPRISQQAEVFLESHQNIENCSAFAPDQLMKLMFSALYPIYLASPEHQRFLKFGLEFGENEGETSETPRVEKMQRTSKLAKRAQQLLLGCAAYFDESILCDELKQPTWPAAVTDAFDSCPLSITVIDISQAHLPIIYANTAFLALTKPQVLGESLELLNGVETEPTQLALLQEALRSRTASKLAITHYSRGNKPFINLVAMQPVGCYMGVVHFAATRLAHVDDLKMVDDVLVLMSLVLRPPVPAAPLTPKSESASLKYASQKWMSLSRYVSSKRRNSVLVAKGTVTATVVVSGSTAATVDPAR